MPFIADVVNLASNPAQTYITQLYLLLFLICYANVLFCSVSIAIHLRLAARAHLLDISKMARLKGQMNTILLVQAALPLIFDFLPTTCATMVLYMRVHLPVLDLSSLIFAWWSWAPVINAVAMLMVVKPYRRALMQLTNLTKD